MNLIIVVAAIISIFVIRAIQNYFQNVFNYWNKRGVKGPTPLPVFGNFLVNFIKAGNEIEMERARKYGRVYGTFEFSRPMLTIADPAIIREVTIKQFTNFPIRYNRIVDDEFLNKIMFFTDYESWRKLRTCLSPLFTSKKLKAMLKHVDQCAENTLQYIRSKGQEEVIIKDLMLSFTMDVIAKCAFGVDTNGYKNPQDEFLMRARQLANVNYLHLFASLLIPKKIQKLHKSFEFSFWDLKLYAYFKNILISIINQRKISEIRNDDFINLMLSLEEIDNEEDAELNAAEIANYEIKSTTTKLNQGKNEIKTLTNDEILAQSFMLFVAGYETTSTLLNFAIYSLVMNPDIQDKLFDEVVKYSTTHDIIDLDTINSMPYLDAFINESMRMYPPIVALDRVATNDTVVGEPEIKIEKGTVVNLSFYAVHHDPAFFPDPESFKPERFLQEKHLIEPYTFIPFGVGPRNCIGMRFALMTAKLILVKIVKQFRITKTKNTPLKPKYIPILGALASEPLIVSFELREGKNM